MKSLEEFYPISPEEVRKQGATGLLNYIYDGSLVKALQSVYSNHTWYPWKFEQRVDRGFWEKMENESKFLYII